MINLSALTTMVSVTTINYSGLYSSNVTWTFRTIRTANPPRNLRYKERRKDIYESEISEGFISDATD